eukprot:6197880-Pleurochrysis_carterae.AAC.1
MMVAEYCEQLLADAKPAKCARATAPPAPRARKQKAEADGATSPAPAEAELPWLEAFEQAKKAQRSQAELCADTFSLMLSSAPSDASALRLAGQGEARMPIAFAQARAQSMNPSPRRFFAFYLVCCIYFSNHQALFFCVYAAFWEQLERISLKLALKPYHAVVGRVADKTGCKRITGEGEDWVTLGMQPAGRGKKGPSRPTETINKTSTTLASRLAVRLVAARSLHQDEERSIPMRAQSRIALAPEAVRGRSTL